MSTRPQTTTLTLIVDMARATAPVGVILRRLLKVLLRRWLGTPNRTGTNGRIPDCRVKIPKAKGRIEIQARGGKVLADMEAKNQLAKHRRKKGGSSNHQFTLEELGLTLQRFRDWRSMAALGDDLRAELVAKYRGQAQVPRARVGRRNHSGRPTYPSPCARHVRLGPPGTHGAPLSRFFPVCAWGRTSECRWDDSRVGRTRSSSSWPGRCPNR